MSVFLAGNRRPLASLALVPRFYFHQHVNGRLIVDREGAVLGDAVEACACAVQRAPVRLRKAIRHEATNYLATEVSDGERTLYVIRGKIIVERR
jgi:hypothetical protein